MWQRAALHILSSYCSIYGSIRTAQAMAPAERWAAASFPRSFQTSCFRVDSRHFYFARRRGGREQPYQTFMRTKWRCKLGVPILMAEDGVPSLIFAME